MGDAKRRRQLGIAPGSSEWEIEIKQPMASPPAIRKALEAQGILLDGFKVSDGQGGLLTGCFPVEVKNQDGRDILVLAYPSIAPSGEILVGSIALMKGQDLSASQSRLAGIPGSLKRRIHLLTAHKFKELLHEREHDHIDIDRTPSGS